MRMAVIDVNTAVDRDLGSVISDVKLKLKDIRKGFFEGYFTEFGGEYERMLEYFMFLGYAMILAIILGVVAYRLWQRARRARTRNWLLLVGVGIVALGAAFFGASFFGSAFLASALGALPVARFDRPSRCTLPITALRVTPPSSLAIWALESPSERPRQSACSRSVRPATTLLTSMPKRSTSSGLNSVASSPSRSRREDDAGPVVCAMGSG